MTTKTADMLHTDVPIAPGLVLADELESREMTQKELALRAHRPPQVINEIVLGKKAITADTALEFEKVLGIAAQIWLNLESLYQIDLAKQRELQDFTRWAERLDEFPVLDMKKRGLLPDTRDRLKLVDALLKFFGVATLDAALTEAAVGFRITGVREKVSPGALAVWLRQGVLRAQQIATEPYNERAFLNALKEIRGMTVLQPSEFCPQMTELCRRSGVALVFVREYPKSGANACARWLGKSKAMIQLSIRNKRADSLWFSFFHEAKHILAHANQVFVDGLDGEDLTAEEEANTFAGEWLIPSKDLELFVRHGDYSPAAMRAFAKDIGIDLGIVVGRLQHDKFGYKFHASLVKRFAWVERVQGA